MNPFFRKLLFSGIMKKTAGFWVRGKETDEQRNKRRNYGQADKGLPVQRHQPCHHKTGHCQRRRYGGEGEQSHRVRIRFLRRQTMRTEDSGTAGQFPLGKDPAAVPVMQGLVMSHAVLPMLFIAQRLNGIEESRFAGRVYAKKQADAHRETESHENRGR